MKLHRYLFLFLLYSLSVTAYSQSDSALSAWEGNNASLNDSVMSRLMAETYYQVSSTLDRDFDYEKLNKKRKLKRYSVAVWTLGFAASIGILAGGGWLAAEYDWSPWIETPCAMALATATLYSCGLWAKSLRKKADKIEVATLFDFPTGQKSSIGVVTFNNQTRPSDLSLGLSLKMSF